MYQLVEIWSQKPAWNELAPVKQQAFLDTILGKVGLLMESGLELVASGFIENKLPNSLPFQYYAFWQSPDEALVQTFTHALLDAGWFNYFDQVNVGGYAEPLSDILKTHVAA